MLKKKNIILISASLIGVIGLVVTSIILVKNSDNSKDLNATVVNVASKRKLIENYIIDWDSNAKTHAEAIDANAKCSISVNGKNYSYDNIQEGWTKASTTYKNIGSLTFTLYSDWIASENGYFGTDENKDYFGGTGSVKIWGWTSTITLDLNGYKIDRNLKTTTVESGETLCIDNSNEVYVKNGCITGGADNGDGGGVWIKGEDTDGHFENMTITGNISGTKGGGIYSSQKIKKITLKDTIIEGNYAADCGAGMFVDHQKSITESSVCVLDLYGKIIINNNVAGDKTRRNLTLRNFTSTSDENAKIENVELTDDSCIYVSLSKADSSPFRIVKDPMKTTEKVNCFHLDDDNCELYLNYSRYNFSREGYYFSIKLKGEEASFFGCD